MRTRELREQLEHVTRRLDELVAVVALAYVVVMSFRRLRYGVDLHDESWAIVMSQRYALGDRPYVDELNLRQTAALFELPFCWCYLKIVGSTDGIVYFFRHVFFGVQAFVGYSVYALASRRVPRAFALVAAALPFVFVPFCMPVCSYNGLGAMFLAAATFVGLRALLDDPRPRGMVLAGVLYALASAVYPPNAVPTLLFALSARFLPEVRRESPIPPKAGRRKMDPRPWRRVLLFAGGLSIVAIPLAAVVVPALPALKNALLYEGMLTRARTLEKVQGILAAVVKLSPASPSSVTTLAVAGLLAARGEAVRRVVFAVVVAYLAWWFSEVQPELKAQLPSHVLTLHFVIYLGLLGGFFGIFTIRNETTRTMLLVGWLPSVVAGGLSAYASDNAGCMNGAIGLFAGAALAMVFLPMSVAASTMSVFERTVAVAVAALVPLSMLSNYTTTLYRGAAITEGMPKVTIGPFRGLRGLPLDATRAEELTRELRPFVGPGEKMLAFYDYPAAYLVTATRPALPTSWSDPRANFAFMLPYYQRQRTGRGIVFVQTNISSPSKDLEKLVETPERLLKDCGWFRIYREPPP